MKKALLSLHAAIFLAGFSGILGRLITLNEGLLVWWRLFITSCTLAMIFLFTGGLQKVALSLHLRILATGAVVALHWVLFYGSIKYANVSVALVCFSAIGFFSAFLEPLILHRKIDWVEVLYGTLAIAGIWLIFHFDKQYKLGILLGIISSLFAALFPVLNKKIIRHISPQSLTFYELTGGLIVLTLSMPFYLGFFPEDHVMPTAGDFLWLLVLGWFCTVLAFNLSLQALKKISPFTVNLSYNLEPVYGIILAFIVYDEHEYLSSGFYCGLSLILLTVALQTRRLYYRRA
ncbi:DMT family transporter [Agriterribacter sp.]|uniref:DMT family transporter n=1 Tax=Agriterribacter sp. TaxID=2821509 RepID=UPI002BAA7EF7|nr:DMT family transporter [Agriterribacter sp.]HRP54404.1 DMT family transporter [Agriterribacter sp.]